MKAISADQFSVGTQVVLTQELYKGNVGVPHPHGTFYEPGLSGEITKFHKNHLTEINLKSSGLNTGREYADCYTIRFRLGQYHSEQLTLPVSKMLDYFALA